MLAVGVVLFGTGIALALGAVHIGWSTTPEGGARLGAEMPIAYTQTETVEISKELTEGSMPPKEGESPGSGVVRHPPGNPPNP
jgi:hypothetical protein